MNIAIERHFLHIAPFAIFIFSSTEYFQQHCLVAIGFYLVVDKVITGKVNCITIFGKSSCRLVELGIDTIEFGFFKSLQAIGIGFVERIEVIACPFRAFAQETSAGSGINDVITIESCTILRFTSVNLEQVEFQPIGIAFYLVLIISIFHKQDCTRIVFIGNSYEFIHHFVRLFILAFTFKSLCIAVIIFRLDVKRFPFGIFACK